MRGRWALQVNWTHEVPSFLVSPLLLMLHAVDGIPAVVYSLIILVTEYRSRIRIQTYFEILDLYPDLHFISLDT